MSPFFGMVSSYPALYTPYRQLTVLKESVISAAGCSGFNAARFVCKAAETLGAVRSVKFYTTLGFATRGAFPNLRSEFKHAGVTVVDTASTGREASAVKVSLSAC
jgi:hypothetical protein